MALKTNCCGLPWPFPPSLLLPTGWPWSSQIWSQSGNHVLRWQNQGLKELESLTWGVAILVQQCLPWELICANVMPFYPFFLSLHASGPNSYRNQYFCSAPITPLICPMFFSNLVPRWVTPGKNFPPPADLPEPCPGSPPEQRDPPHLRTISILGALWHLGQVP